MILILAFSFSEMHPKIIGDSEKTREVYSLFQDLWNGFIIKGGGVGVQIPLLKDFYW